MEMEPHRMEIHSAQKNQNEIPRLVLNRKQQKHLITSVFINYMHAEISLSIKLYGKHLVIKLPDFFILQDSIIKKLLLAFHVAIAFAFTLTLLLLVTQY